jgi:hypothetical protein
VQVSDHYQKPKPCSIHLQDLRKPLDVWKSLSTSPAPSDSAQAVLLPHEYKCMWGALKKARQKVNKKLEEARQRGVIKSSLEAKLTLHVTPRGGHPATMTASSDGAEEASTDASGALAGRMTGDMASALWLLAQSERERAERERLEYDLLSEYFVVSACSAVQGSDATDGHGGSEEADGGSDDGGDDVTAMNVVERKRQRGDRLEAPKQQKTKKLGWLTVTVERMPGDKCPRCWRWTTTPHANLLCVPCFAAVAKRAEQQHAS